MVVNDSKLSDKSRQKYNCLICDYYTSKKNDFIKHTSTDKHKNATNGSKMVVNGSDLSQKVAQLYNCHCGKKYKYESGYYRHKKKCCSKQEFNEPINKDLIMLLIKENVDLKNVIVEQSKETNEFKNIMMEVIKNGINNTSTITNNSHNNNKTFNLNFFLNETCKNAMNISDFINSIQLQLSDLEEVGEIGFVNGISNIIVQKLKNLDVTERPIHCTDSKREIMYIKDENKWERENDENIKLRKVIKHIAFKNTKLLREFKSKYPDCGKSESKYSDQYNKLIIEAMGGNGDNEWEKENKIIKKIAKEVIIQK
jgi:hypothetical protein